MRNISKIHASQLTNSFTFESYKELLQALVVEGKTSGPDQREDLIHYTELNAKRMKRIEKTTVLKEELKNLISSIQEPMTWVLISEAWCGDAAQIVPVLGKIAAESELIDLQIILRDEHLDIMDQYLTNGGRSIPKLICLDQEDREIFVWGPRPAAIQQVVNDCKAEGITDHAVLVKRIQYAYNEDQTHSIQQEISDILANL
ncbi:MAG: thioredoxin family protein [Flavobacteriia bacterium]